MTSINSFIVPYQTLYSVRVNILMRIETFSPLCIQSVTLITSCSWIKRKMYENGEKIITFCEFVS
jgi:hypothetical protein